MRKSIGFIFLALLLSSCNEHNSTSGSVANNSASNSVISNSISNSQPSASPSVVTNQNVVKLTNFKNRLLTLKHEVSSCVYTTNQIDNFNAINIEATESGTKNLYSGNFMINSFDQKIGDTTLSGRRELGLINNSIYQINYFGENDTSNNVKYYEDNETSRQGLLQLDFVTDYVMNILDLTISYYEQSGRYSLTTNFENITFPNDGTIKLEYRFINYSNDGRVKVEDIQRDDTLTIENNRIVAAKTTMFYGIENSVNYKYKQSEFTYKYDALTEYTEEKLDPTKF